MASTQKDSRPLTIAVQPPAVQVAANAGSTSGIPPFVATFLRPGDRVLSLSSEPTEILVERGSADHRATLFLHATIGCATLPKQSEKVEDSFVRAILPKCSSRLKALVLSGDAIRRYFYLLRGDHQSPSLYELLRSPESATPSGLRMAWRLRRLELSSALADCAQRVNVERAFNIVAHPDLRNCYDALRNDEYAPALFPYGGFGTILVEGRLSNDGEAFFANRILAYKPEVRARKASLLLRQCEFLADRVICRDRRRKLEVSLDAMLLPGLSWDLSWNNWKYWLRSRIDVDATFVRAGKYRLRGGEWILRTWHTALPSRLRVTVPEGIAADVERAKAIHSLLGEHTEVVERIRTEVREQPVEHGQIQDWFDRLSASPHLKPQHVTWGPDYEPYYFEQLRRRSTTWFLLRDEYLFVWANVLIAEIPQLGHATYVFARPEDVRAFMRRYSGVTRDDIRRNCENVATDLGFVGRVVRSRKKKRWLNDVLKLAGEKADYVEVFE